MNIQDLASRFGGATPAASFARVNAQLPLAVSVVAVVLIGYYLAKLVWALYPTPPLAPWAPPMPTSGLGPTTVAAADYSAISNAHLFGEASTEAPTLTGDEGETAPDTSLSLQLRGVVAAEDARYAHAIIADSNGNEQVYFAKASVPGGATVQKIQSDRVILARSGQLEVLRLPREGENGSGARAPGPSATFRPPALPSQPNVQELVAQNAAGFLEVVRPQPFMPNGQLKGYRIYPGPNRQQFTALGLRAGDLVTEINGIALNNPTQGMEVFRSLGDAAQVTVTVERDGQPSVLSLNMNQINAAGASQ